MISGNGFPGGSTVNNPAAVSQTGRAGPEGFQRGCVTADSPEKELSYKGASAVSGSVPGSGRSPGGGHDNPLQYSCLENSVDRGGWRATVHGASKSWT